MAQLHAPILKNSLALLATAFTGLLRHDQKILRLGEYSRSSMTSLQLLLCIVAGVLIQLAIYLGIGFLRHWQSYQILRTTVVGAGLSLATVDSATLREVSPPAWKGFRAFRVVNKCAEDANGEVCSFYLEPQDGQGLPPFKPGQFLTFQLEIANADGRMESVVRCYSLSDAPQSGSYRVSIKRVHAPPDSELAGGRSSNYFHDQIHVGSILQVREPGGHFYLEAGESPIVLIAGGIGITPMLSMLNWCTSAQPDREVWLFYGIRDSSELVMSDHLQSLASARPNLHLHFCFSDPQPWDLHTPQHITGKRHHSRVNVALLRALLPLKPFHFYICGPTPMLQSLVPALDDWGVSEERIHFEAFGPASISRKKALHQPQPAPSHSDAKDIMVTFSKSDKKLAWTPGCGNLLQFAEAHGIAVNSGCRAGSCGSCQTSIHSGEVTYSQLPDFDPELGSCLLCVTTPKTALTLEV